jgi:hypothetical protein
MSFKKIDINPALFSLSGGSKTKKNRANITKKKIRAADVYTHRHRPRHRQTNAHMNEYIYGNTHSYLPTHNIL